MRKFSILLVLISSATTVGWYEKVSIISILALIILSTFAGYGAAAFQDNIVD